MEADNRTISVTITKLIVGFFNETLTVTEHNRLDEWICENDDNMIIFEEMVELVQSRNDTRMGYSFN